MSGRRRPENRGQFTRLEQQHDALFIGMGLGADQWLGLPGATLHAVRGAVANAYSKRVPPRMNASSRGEDARE